METTKPAAIAKASFVVGLADFFAFYTLRTWLFGWLSRVIFQVLFFALIGRYLGKPHEIAFLVVGAAAAISVLETMAIVLYTAYDRLFGMLPLLVAAPGGYFVVVVSRNIFNCVLTGTFTATVALFLCAGVMDVPVNYPAALLAVAVIGLGAASTYLFGIFLSALAAKQRRGRWVVLNISYISLTALGGFLIPVGFWPSPFTWLAKILPYTHALRALRGLVLGGMPATRIAASLGLELAVAAGWFLVAYLAFRRSIERARRDGSIGLTGA